MKNADKKSNKPARTKPVVKALPFIVTGKDQHGNDYDANSALALVADLQEAGTFDKLSIMAIVGKKYILNKEDAHGTMSIARVQSYNAESGNVDLLFFGKNTEYANAVENMAVVPRVRTDRDSKVTTILAFEIVNMMEA